MAHYDCDVAVIGAGTAGISAERKARGEGAKTLLIDPYFNGTTCATVGCMPSKLLIAASDAMAAVRGAGAFGIKAEGKVDGPAVLERVRRFRDEFAGGVRASFDRLPEDVPLRGRARFTAPGELETDQGDTVSAKAVVVATGSAPAIPGPFKDFGDLILTNESIFELKDLPDSMGVIGAGAIGVELAQAMARLGVRVELYDMGHTIAGMPAETGGVLRDLLALEFNLHMGVTPEAEQVKKGVRITYEGHEAEFERLLIAAGRPPNLDGLDLEKSGMAFDEDGRPVVNPDCLQCTDVPVFMAGDVNGVRPLLHEASDEGAIAGYNAAHFPDIRRTDRKTALAITFTRPSAAIVGILPSNDNDLVTGRADFSNQGRSRVEDRAGGMIRVHADRKTGKLVGADLCLPDGEHIAHQMAWIIGLGIDAGAAKDLPFYHPTIEEGVKSAFRDLCAAIEAGVHWTTDEGSPPGV
ncbi:dihydrolipoamide dehydrogenase [Oceanicola sp. 22II-s10i]|uniref:dihydrolipoyl dehydrogenase n=1 Tax=Oceanicola sp. 22II-s10i TaxID=1317116 RepID=UPI000B523817|nr:dihydrolipoyl dehydrogenase [Oceanicola sp. 22II-s10i]OWU86226.1 dihydrolipoamide dehydrogenase [Oceanicola sp. 22II-s10i]